MATQKANDSSSNAVTDGAETGDALAGRFRPTISDIYDWARRLTAESRPRLWTRQEYCAPLPIVQLLSRLTQSSRQLIAVIGCQAVGKTSAMQDLEYELNVLYYNRPSQAVKKKDGKQSPDLRPDAIAFNYSDLESYLNLQASSEDPKYMVLRPHYLAQVIRFLRLKRYRHRQKDEFLVSDAEIVLGAVKTRMARMHALRESVRGSAHFLVDLPDYGRTDRRRMAGDLGQIQVLWRNVMGGFEEDKRFNADLGQPRTDFVIFIQEESFTDHFFFGKMDVVRIAPFTAEELVEAYKRKFKGTYPFTEDALLHLARPSRGTFRKFLLYIMLSLDKYRFTEGRTCHMDPALMSYRLSKTGLLNKSFVAEAIPREQLSRDLDASLSRIFPKNQDNRLLASQILNLLSQKQPLNQKAIAQQLQLPEYKLSRIMSWLEAAGFIEREKVGLEKLVRLAESL